MQNHKYASQMITESVGEAGLSAEVGLIGEVAIPFGKIASSSDLFLCIIVGSSGIIEGHK